ncbi:Monocarboxylate transporter 9, partial [Lamellibrachia satsuma]
VYLPSVISVSFYFEKRRALATGIAVCGAGVGCFIFAPIGGLLVDTFDWKKAMLIIAVVVLISVACGMFMVPLQPSKRRRKPREKNLLDRFMVLTNASAKPTDEPNPCDVIKSRSTNELTVNGIHKHSHLHHRRRKGILKEDYARPLYRKDIFYSGSVMRITEFRSQPDVRSYVRSITLIPRDTEPEQESAIWRCLRVPKVAKHVLQDMLDLSLFKNPIFIVVCLGNVFGTIGVYVPYVYLADQAMIMGVPENRAVFLISVIGITNTVGRVAVGWLSDFKWVNTLLVHNIAVLCSGVVCILNMFASTYPLMCVFAASFGLCIATFISLTSIILCEMIGIDKLTNAFGLLAMARGVSVIVGPPIAGFVYDATNDYDDSFHVGGFMLILAGLLFSLLHLPYFRR